MSAVIYQHLVPIRPPFAPLWIARRVSGAAAVLPGRYSPARAMRLSSFACAGLRTPTCCCQWQQLIQFSSRPMRFVQSFLSRIRTMLTVRLSTAGSRSSSARQPQRPRRPLTTSSWPPAPPPARTSHSPSAPPGSGRSPRPLPRKPKPSTATPSSSGSVRVRCHLEDTTRTQTFSSIDLISAQRASSTCRWAQYLHQFRRDELDAAHRRIFLLQSP